MNECLLCETADCINTVLESATRHSKNKQKFAKTVQKSSNVPT